MSKKWRFVAAFVVPAALGGASLYVAARSYARTLEPRVREHAIRYLESRFDSEVEIQHLRIHLTGLAPMRALFHRGHGVGAQIEGEGVILRHHGRHDVPPLFTVQKFRCRFDAGTWLTSGAIEQLTLEHMEIHVPPAGERGAFAQNEHPASAWPLVFDKVTIAPVHLVILPKDPTRRPLEFSY